VTNTGCALRRAHLCVGGGALDGGPQVERERAAARALAEQRRKLPPLNGTLQLGRPAQQLASDKHLLGAALYKSVR